MAVSSTRRISRPHRAVRPGSGKGLKCLWYVHTELWCINKTFGFFSDFTHTNPRGHCNLKAVTLGYRLFLLTRYTPPQTPADKTRRLRTRRTAWSATRDKSFCCVVLLSCSRRQESHDLPRPAGAALSGVPVRCPSSRPRSCRPCCPWLPAAARGGRRGRWGRPAPRGRP